MQVNVFELLSELTQRHDTWVFFQYEGERYALLADDDENIVLYNGAKEEVVEHELEIASDMSAYVYYTKNGKNVMCYLTARPMDDWESGTNGHVALIEPKPEKRYKKVRQ